MIKQNKSCFAAALARLLDETELFDRLGWASLLGISQAAISQWTNDRTIPRPDYLHVIYDTVNISDVAADGPLAEFKRMAERPAPEVSPHGERMEPTVWSYMTRPSVRETPATSRKVPVKDNGLTQSAEPSRRGDRGRDARVFLSYSTHAHEADVFQKHLERYHRTAQPVIPLKLRRLEHESEAELPLESVLSQHRVVIFGHAGSGKTTAAKWLHDYVSRAYSRDEETARLPVSLTAAALYAARLDGGEIADVIRKQAPVNCGFERILFIVDGVDEVPIIERKVFYRILERFAEEQRELKIIFTSRPTLDSWSIKDLTKYELLPLSESRVIRCAENLLIDRLAGTDLDWDERTSRFMFNLFERRDVMDTLRTPLFLSLATELCARNDLTAFYATDIFDECLRYLIDEWDRRKYLVRSQEPSARPAELQRILTTLSYRATFTDAHEFTVSQAQGWFGNRKSKHDIEDALELLFEKTGLLRRSAQSWSFVNDTFRNFLAARYAVDSCQDLKELFGKHSNFWKTREMFRLACAMTNQADPLISFVLKDADLPEAQRMTLLAQILAQPFSATESIVTKSCAALVEWLGEAAGLNPVRSVDSIELSPTARWHLIARSSRPKQSLEGEHGRAIRSIFQSLHRLRAGPARDHMTKRLQESKAAVLRQFAPSLMVDGVYRDRVIQQEKGELLVAEIMDRAA